ncbi:ATP-dependent protease subunit HslV [Striga asiatica]|uniref:ATP-dependent protease subunit HslV n=1 Tax=Striga asiatica TaxID=4170 RepID=A0A5A7PHU8_STRAF|nr:ATP-dependent protease subunit HslV [Striga asiatica]
MYFGKYFNQFPPNTLSPFKLFKLFRRTKTSSKAALIGAAIDTSDWKNSTPPMAAAMMYRFKDLLSLGKLIIIVCIRSSVMKVCNLKLDIQMSVTDVAQFID